MRLLQFAICVGIVFLVELAISITVLVMATRAESALEDLLQDEAIVEYRDDINKQNVIDWFQETVSIWHAADSHSFRLAILKP